MIPGNFLKSNSILHLTFPPELLKKIYNFGINSNQNPAPKLFLLHKSKPNQVLILENFREIQESKTKIIINSILYSPFIQNSVSRLREMPTFSIIIISEYILFRLYNSKTLKLTELKLLRLKNVFTPAKCHNLFWFKKCL